MKYHTTIKSIATALITVVIIMSSCHQEEVQVAADDTTVINVKVNKVGSDNMPTAISATGKIQSSARVNVAARMMGYAQTITVDLGDRVRQGQRLAQLSVEELNNQKSQINASIAELNAMISNVDKNYNRMKALYDKKSATQKELDDISTQKDAMAAKLSQAKEKLNELNTMMSYATISSPINGVIVEKMIEQGELVNPGRPMFAIEGVGRYEASVMIPESAISQIQKGEKVKLTLKSTGEILEGKIAKINTSALRTGGQYEVIIDLSQEAQKKELFSGMYVSAEIAIPVTSQDQSASTSTITVDQSAIVHKGQLVGIYTITDDQKAMLRFIRTGKTIGDQVEVLSGLSSGESYILTADGRLYNGVKVNIQ